MKNWKEEITQIINSAKTKIADIDFSQGTISYSEKITSHEKITLLRKSDSKENDEEYVRAYLTNKLVNDVIKNNIKTAPHIKLDDLDDAEDEDFIEI